MPRRGARADTAADASPPPPLPARVGPCEFSMLGAMVAVRCPQEFADIILRAGGLWEPGSRRWLVERRRIGPGDPRAPAGNRPAVPARWHVAGLGSVHIWTVRCANDRFVVA